MKSNPSNNKGDNLSVEMISWFDAIEYCNKLSILEGLKPCYSIEESRAVCDFNKNGYRLPTEDEWEYAARGGLHTKNFVYAGSNDIEKVAWYKNNSKGVMHEVRSKSPNELNLFDMSGNVWEWCWDWYSENREHNNGTGLVYKNTKVYRGGSYLDFDYGCTVFARGHRIPKLRQIDIGFRFVKTILI